MTDDNINFSLISDDQISQLLYNSMIDDKLNFSSMSDDQFSSRAFRQPPDETSFASVSLSYEEFKEGKIKTFKRR